MNWVDLLLAAVIVLGAFTGWRRGFVRATLFLLTLAASLAVALLAWRHAALWITQPIPQAGVWAAPASFVLIALGCQLLLDTLVHAALSRLPRRAELNPVNQALGVLPGLANGALHAVVIALLLMTVPTLDAVSRATRESALAEHLAAPADWLESRLQPIFDPAVQRTLRALTVPAESQARIGLPFTVQDARPRPDLEARMLALVNGERQQHGLDPLAADEELRAVASAHSADMFARGYFSHVSPDGRTLAQRLRRERVRSLVAGENLALAHSLAAAHQGLMQSPGHRANILRPQFGRVGIAVLDGGAHGLMITQNFRN